MRQVPPAYTPTPPTALSKLASASAADLEALRELLLGRFSADHVELVGSGTQALTLALQALATPGASVALPGWGCFDLASAAVGADVPVRLYDLDPTTLQPDWSSLEALIDQVGVVVLVSFFGILVDPGPWVDRFASTGVALVHDAAQAHGAAFGTGSIDEIADATVLSFGRGKGWTGLAGGALIPRSARAQHGVADQKEAGTIRPASGGRLGMGLRGLAQWLLGRPSIYGLPARIPRLGLGETRYHPPTAVEALDPASAAVLLGTREAADREARYRRERADELQAVLRDAPSWEPIVAGSDGSSGFLRLPVLDVTGVDRVEARAHGILPSYPIALAHLDPLKPLLRAADPVPGSERLAERLLTLPTHSRTSASDRGRLEEWLRAATPPRR